MSQLENVAIINDVLSLKAARGYAIANVKWLGSQNTSNLTSMAKFGWVPLVDLRVNAWQQSRTKNLRMVLENSGPILSRL